jgi:hypothetical protein
MKTLLFSTCHIFLLLSITTYGQIRSNERPGPTDYLSGDSQGNWTLSVLLRKKMGWQRSLPETRNRKSDSGA